VQSVGQTPVESSAPAEGAAAPPPALVAPFDAPVKRSSLTGGAPEAHPDAEKWNTPSRFDKWLAEEAKKARERMKAMNALALSRGSEYKDEDPYMARRAFQWARMASRYVEGVSKYAWVTARRARAAKELGRRKTEEEARRAALIASQEQADAERKPPADPRAVGLLATAGGVMCAMGFPAALMF